MTGSLWQGQALSQDAVASTPAGDIWLSPSFLAVMPADEAWLGLRELHFAAIGDVGYPYQTDAGSLFPDDAQAAYSSAVAAVLGQIGVTDSGAGDRLLGSICTSADLYGGFDGMEGPALSAYLSAGRGGVASPEMEQFQWLFSGLGAPDVAGGGFLTSALFNPQSRDLAFPDVQRLGQLAESMTGMSTSGFRDQVISLARDGVSSVLTDSGVSPRAVKDAANAFGSAAEGAGLGAAIGSFFGPEGTLIGGIFGGIVGFFTSLFGGDEQTASQQRDVARDVASGERAVVHSDLPATKDGERTVVSSTTTTTTTTTTVNPDGTTTTTTTTSSTVTTAPAGARNPAQEPPQGTVVHPTEVGCRVDDGYIDPDFVVPYWADRTTLIGSGVPLGPGRDGFVTATATANNQWAALRLTELPAVDELGVLQAGGLTLDTVYQELSVAQRGNQTWDEVVATVTGAGRMRVPTMRAGVQRGRVPTVPADVVINRLRLEGFRPDDSLAHVLRTLATRYGR